ncbi:Uncharacterized protein APZ42_032013 [Daphnia magna]|uniref:Uncharacterized protein n=1 Tax=Daphnia magna TaxID=35525 RepID=A0A164MFW9_9CRUS|nr:Uncharacterized protein APZ42_032013 [Daphnia magna]
MQTRINLLVQLIAVILTLICIESHFAITSAFLVPAFPFSFLVVHTSRTLVYTW